MPKRKTDIGAPLPIGDPSGRFWPVPVSVEQARARVLDQMNHLEMAVHDGIDVAYAFRCLDETLNDYTEIVLGR